MGEQQIMLNIPETVLLAEKTDAETFARKLRTPAAVKVYEMGRLSSGRAAEPAELLRVEFLLNLYRYRVFPLTAELEELESARGHRG
ncbi:MAG: UPF0175 family protein [Roseiflexus sp.]